MSDDHDKLVRVAAHWERLYGELFVKAQHLTEEIDTLRTQEEYTADAMRGLVATVDELRAENAELRARMDRYRRRA